MDLRNGILGSLLVTAAMSACYPEPLPEPDPWGGPDAGYYPGPDYGGPAQPFPATVTYPAPADSVARDLLLVDLDADGKRDVAAVFQESNGTRVVTLRGMSAGEFAHAQTYRVADSAPRAQALLQGDAVELAVFGVDEARRQATLDVFRLGPDGPERSHALSLDVPPATSAAVFSTALAALAAHDVNQDGTPDLLLAVTDTDGRLVVHTLLRAADGTFQDHAQAVSQPSGFTHAAFADVDGDARPDLVAVDFLQTLTHVYFGNADSTFRSGPAMEWGIWADEPTQVITGDFDHDGDTDIRTLHESCYDVYYRNHGDGSFDSPTVFHTQMDPTFQEAVGVRTDGKTELMITGATNVVERLVLDAQGYVEREEMLQLPGTHGGSFSFFQEAAFPSIRVVSADLNGDRQPDYVFADGTGVLVNLSSSTGVPLR